MSEYYWNEYIKYFLDEELYKATLKYHQKTIYKDNSHLPMMSEKKNLLQAGIVKASDIKHMEKYVHTLDTSIKDIYFSLKEGYADLDIKVSIPIIIVASEKIGVDVGAYTTDFLDDTLVPIKLFSNGELKNVTKSFQEQELIVAFFLNIEQALALYGKKGYCRGIEEIGYISYMLKKKYNVFSDYYTIPEQGFTHDIGVNLRKCLLIDQFGMSLRNENDFC